MSDELKPCPFCEGKCVLCVDEEIHSPSMQEYSIECHDCGLLVMNGWFYRSDAVSYWNQREEKGDERLRD